MEIKRIGQEKLEKKIKLFGAIQITGPKWCGKTYLGMLCSNSFYYMQYQAENNKLLLDDESKSSVIFDGEKPRLIDEWQIVPQVWDRIRYLIDISNGQRGQYILTGSTTPIEAKQIIHSGAGRFGKLELFTLTFNEIFPNEAKYSIRDLFLKKVNNVDGKLSINSNTVFNQLLIGGWPELVANGNHYESEKIVDYINWIVNSDTEKINNTRKSISNFKKLLKSISRLNCSILNQSTIATDTGLNIRTVSKYMEVLESLNLIYYLNSWSSNARSKTNIRTKPKLYLCDPSLGLNVLGFKNFQNLMSDLNTTGFYFENQVVKDLIVYANVIDANIFYYNDNNRYEVDIIIQDEDKNLCFFEIKMKNMDLTKEIENLINIKNKFVQEYKTKEPTLVIITGGELAYTYNGVHVIPHAMLKP